MKTYINDSPNENRRSHKENNIIKKGNISNKISKYNRYFSSSLPKENKTIKKYINEKLSSIRNNNINTQKTLIERNPKISNLKYKTNLIYKKINLASSLNIKKKYSNDNIKPKYNLKGTIYNKKNISTIKINNANDINNNFYYDNSKKINSITTSASARRNTFKKVTDPSKFNNCNYYRSIYNNKRLNSIERNKTLFTRFNYNIRKILDENNISKNKINIYNYKIKNNDSNNINENNNIYENNNINENIILQQYDSQGSKKYRDENINYNNLSYCIDDYNHISNKTINYVNKLKEENDVLKKELKE